VGGRLVGPVGGGKLVHRRQPALHARRRHVILGGSGAAALVRRCDARITAQCWGALWRRCGRHAPRHERYHLHSAPAARESTSRCRCRHPSRYRAVALGSSSHDAAAPWAPAIAVSAAGIPTRGSGWTRDGRHRVGHYASTASLCGARHHRCAFGGRTDTVGHVALSTCHLGCMCALELHGRHGGGHGHGGRQHCRDPWRDA